MGTSVDPGASNARATPTWVQPAGATLMTLAFAAVGTYICSVPGGASDADSETWIYVFTLPFRLAGLCFVGIIAGLVGGAAFGESSSPWVGMSVAIGGFVIGGAAAVAGHAGYGSIVMIGIVPFAIAAGLGAAVGRRTGGRAGDLRLPAGRRRTWTHASSTARGGSSPDPVSVACRPEASSAWRSSTAASGSSARTRTP